MPSDGDHGDNFGTAAAVSGNRLFVGSPDADKGGAVYAYFRDVQDWAERRRLAASDAGFPQGFGFELAVDGDRLIIGAPFDSDARGAVDWFERVGSQWLETARLKAIRSLPGDQFGKSIGLHGDRVVLGAWYSALNGNQSGRATAFDLREVVMLFCSGDGSAVPCSCANSGLPAHGCGNSATPGGAALFGSGSSSVVDYLP